jgi:hypothetical protein
MGEVIPFKKKTLKEKHKGNTLCRQGHHVWEIKKNSQFDVKKGCLVTISKCKRCGVQRNQLR